MHLDKLKLSFYLVLLTGISITYRLLVRKARRRRIAHVLPKYARLFTGACLLFCFLLYREARRNYLAKTQMLNRQLMGSRDYAYYGGYAYEDIQRIQQFQIQQQQQQQQPVVAQYKQLQRPIAPPVRAEAAKPILFEEEKAALAPAKSASTPPPPPPPPPPSPNNGNEKEEVAKPELINEPVVSSSLAPVNASYPDVSDLRLHPHVKQDLTDFLKIGANRARQAAHGNEVPKKRYPELIIVGAKKCGTTALKIFMNYHPGFRDTPGEKHFFNRPSNWNQGFTWYKDQSPLTYADEVTYEKTPDYFDRAFVPERIKQMNQDVKIIAILCDPVRRAYSHFLHAIVVQKNADNGVAMPGWYWLEGHTEFNEVVRIAMRKILGGALPNELEPDEIRNRVEKYYELTKAPINERTYPLRIPEVILTGGLYSHHISNFMRSIKNDNMLLLDASELMDNPGKVMREVAEFVHLDPSINESHFYFDEEKGFYCMRPPEESERGSFCLANDKGRSKNAQVDDETKKLVRLFYAPFINDLTEMYTHKTYEHWDW